MLSQKIGAMAAYLGQHIDENHALSVEQIRGIYANLLAHRDIARAYESALPSDGARAQVSRAEVEVGKVVYLSGRRLGKTAGRPPGGGAA